MDIWEIGKMMYTLRTEKGITQEELCRGLCSVATLSRLEAGERRPDIFVFNALFQRIGKSTDYFNIVFNLEEFTYFAKRRNIEIALLSEDYFQAEKELVLLEEELQQSRISVQRQDIYCLYGILHICKNSNYKEAKEYINRAISQTIADFDLLKKIPNSLSEGIWFSETEVQLMLLYVYIQEKIGEETQVLLENIIAYIRLKISDEKAKNKQLAKALHIQAYLYKQKRKWEKCYKCCETVIEAEVKNGTIFNLYSALEMEMICLENSVIMQNDKIRQKEYRCLKEVFEEYGKEIRRNEVYFIWNNASQEKGLLDEVIHYARLREEYSQEELGEGICSSETISRIELGKNSPTLKKFHAIMEKLELGLGYFNTEFVVEKFETLQKIEKLNYLNTMKKREEAEVVLDEIEKEIDIRKNAQQLGLYHVVFDYRLGRITVEEALSRTEELLGMSLKKNDNSYEVPVFLSSVEISLFNQIAVYYRIMQRKEEAVKLLKTLHKYFKKSKISACEQSKKYFMLVSNLAMYMEEIDEFEEAIKFSNAALSLSFQYNMGTRLGRNLITKAYTQERMKDNNCKKNYERGYYLCGLYEDFRNQKIVKKQVLKNWDIKYED